MLKLAEITQEQGLDIIADILVPVMNIAEDEKAREFFAVEKTKEGESVIQAAIRRVGACLPALIKSHKDDLIAIMAALNCKSIDEYKNEKGFVGLVKDVIALSKDEDLQGLFTSAESGNSEIPSGSASANTGDEM